MKVIFFPNNTSSLADVHIPALRKLGVEAVGYNFNPLTINDANFVNDWPKNGSIWKQLIYLLRFFSDLLSSDVIHWMYGGNSRFSNLMLFFVKLLSKKKFVEFCGSDVRSLEKLCEDVPSYKFENFSPNFKKRMGTRDNSLLTQRRFKKAGFYPLPSYPELTEYIDHSIFPQHDLINRSVDLKKLIPPPKKNSGKVLIVHAPSNPEIKGTDHINEAASRLVDEGLAEYKLITGMKHSEAMALLKDADIIIDQLVIGEYGVLAIEGMALGKPVVCFIRPAIQEYYRKNFDDFPIVNANSENIYDVLKDLSKSTEKREDIGTRSRSFVLKYHDPIKNAERMRDIYISRGN